MPKVNCSLAALSSSRAAFFHALGCPEAALVCGMNVSRLLAEAASQDLDDMCLSEDAYLDKYRGPPRSPAFFPVCVTYLSIFLMGVLGNSLTCAVILHYRVMQTPTNYYLLSLAASDLLVLLLGMPLELYEMWQNYPFLLGEGGCYFKTFLFETVCFASILNVTALSVERYLAVVHPLMVKHLTTRSHVKKVISLLWLLSMLCAVPNTSVHGIEVLAPKFGREFPRSAICGMESFKLFSSAAGFQAFRVQGMKNMKQSLKFPACCNDVIEFLSVVDRRLHPLSSSAVVKPTWMYNLIILVTTVAFFLLPMLVISVLYLLIGLRLHRQKVETDGQWSFGPGSLSKSHHQRMSKRNLQVTKMLCRCSRHFCAEG